MLEKLAEIVRGQSNSEPYYQGGVIPCFACDMRPVMSTACDKYDLCPNTGEPDGSLMLARWAVLLVAKGLPSWELFAKALQRENELRAMWADMKMGKANFAQTAYITSRAAEEKNRQRDAVVAELADLISEVKEGANG